MRANELRVGNWVSQYGLNFKLELEDFKKPNLNPIPLTEEWLLKFGFEEQGKSIIFSIEHQGMKLVIDIYQGLNNIHLVFENMSAPLIKIKYVHQLQNLFFALTGEELKLLNNE